MDTVWKYWNTIVEWMSWVWGGLVWVWGWVAQIRWGDIDVHQLTVNGLQNLHWLMDNSATEVAYISNIITISAPIVAYIYRGFLADLLIRFDNQEQKRALQRFLTLTTISISASNRNNKEEAQRSQKALVEEIHINQYVFKSKAFKELYKTWQQANNELRNNIGHIANNRTSKISTEKLKAFQDYLGGMMQQV